MKSFSPVISYKEIYDEKIHSFVNFLLVIVTIVLLFAAGKPVVSACVFTLALIYFSYVGLNTASFAKTILYTFSFSFVYLAMLVLFPSAESFFFGKTMKDIFLSRDFLQTKEYFIFLRLFLVSTVSVMSLSVINAEVVFLYLAQKQKMPVMFVYPLLFAVNSIHLLKKKFDLYRFNNRLRKVKGFVLPRLLFQFLVFTLRFSESGALSLVARGLSENKYYYYDFSLTDRDKKTGAIVSILLLASFIFLFTHV